MNLNNWLITRFLKSYLTQERVLGYVQHGLQFVALWLITNHWLGDSSVFVGSLMSAAAVIWSLATGGKASFGDYLNGVSRQVVTAASSIALFKGWIPSDKVANDIIGVVLAYIALASSANTPEKVKAIRNRKALKGDY